MVSRTQHFQVNFAEKSCRRQNHEDSVILGQFLKSENFFMGRVFKTLQKWLH